MKILGRGFRDVRESKGDFKMITKEGPTRRYERIEKDPSTREYEKIKAANQRMHSTLFLAGYEWMENIHFNGSSNTRKWLADLVDNYEKRGYDVKLAAPAYWVSGGKSEVMQGVGLFVKKKEIIEPKKA